MSLFLLYCTWYGLPQHLVMHSLPTAIWLNAIETYMHVALPYHGMYCPFNQTKFMIQSKLVYILNILFKYVWINILLNVVYIKIFFIFIGPPIRIETNILIRSMGLISEEMMVS